MSRTGVLYSINKANQKTQIFIKEFRKYGMKTAAEEKYS